MIAVASLFTCTEAAHAHIQNAHYNPLKRNKDTCGSVSPPRLSQQLPSLHQYNLVNEGSGSSFTITDNLAMLTLLLAPGWHVCTIA